MRLSPIGSMVGGTSLFSSSVHEELTCLEKNIARIEIDGSHFSLTLVTLTSGTKNTHLCDCKEDIYLSHSEKNKFTLWSWYKD